MLHDHLGLDNLSIRNREADHALEPAVSFGAGIGRAS
jgi:hypothetical protein